MPGTPRPIPLHWGVHLGDKGTRDPVSCTVADIGATLGPQGVAQVCRVSRVDQRWHWGPPPGCLEQRQSSPAGGGACWPTTLGTRAGAAVTSEGTQTLDSQLPQQQQGWSLDPASAGAIAGAPSLPSSVRGRDASMRRGDGRDRPHSTGSPGQTPDAASETNEPVCLCLFPPSFCYQQPSAPTRPTDPEPL